MSTLVGDITEVSQRPDSLDRPAVAWDSAVVLVAFAYFGIRLLLYATSISPIIPPDEVDHFGLSKAFAAALWFPELSPATATYGYDPTRPYLYYFLIGKLLHLNLFGIDDLVLARILNVPLAMGVVAYAYRSSKLFTDSKLAQVLVVVALSNTLQFSTLSATVTYDNLANFLAAFSTFYLFRLFVEFSCRDFALFLAGVLLGCLTKQAFIPLGAILVFAFLIHQRRELLQHASTLHAALRSGPARDRCLLALAALALCLDLSLFGGNMLKYGTWQPRTFQVMSTEMAINHRIAHRNWIMTQYRTGEMTLEEAMLETEKIPNAGNRNRTRQLLALASDPESLKSSIVSGDMYFLVWARIMITRFVGHQGNSKYVLKKSNEEVLLVLGMMIAVFLSFVRHGKSKSWNGVPFYAFWIAGAYIALLVVYVTHPKYVQTGAIDNFVNGRYLFLLMVPLYCLGARYGIAKSIRVLQLPLVLVIGAYFIYSDLPFFMLNATRCFYMNDGNFPECTY